MFTFRKSAEFEDSRFLAAEQNAMDKSKYVESQKVNRDLFFDEKGQPSQDFYIWWIDNHAANFRKAWINSACRKCKYVKECKNCLKDCCTDFLHDPEWHYSFRKDVKKTINKAFSKMKKKGKTCQAITCI